MENKEITPDEAMTEASDETEASVTTPAPSKLKTITVQLVFVCFLCFMSWVWYASMKPEKKSAIMHGANSIMERNEQLLREQRLEYRNQKTKPIHLYLKVIGGTLCIMMYLFISKKYEEAYRKATGRRFCETIPDDH